MVSIRATVADGPLTVTVQDRGVGIPPDDQHHLFERFFRARNVTNIAGTGLGLHIVHNMVRGVLGGQIKAMSEPGRWSEFIVVLPKVAPQHIHD